MALTLQNCSRCNRVYDARSGLDTCMACHEDGERELDLVETSVARGSRSSLSEVVEDTQLSRERVLSILRESRVLTAEMRPEGSCAKCEAREAMPDSDYCLGCRLELFKTLGDVAATAFESMLNADLAPKPPVSVRVAMQDKRRRTGTYRFLTTPPPARRMGR